MFYTISICHPDKEQIEILPNPLSKRESQEFFDNYPWIKQLDFMDQEKIHFSPSIRFTNNANNISLEMTADSIDSKLFFSLWYERPVKTKILFGILGEKDKLKLIEKWGFDYASAQSLLKKFLSDNHTEIERVMNP
jgi:hypothetical protein